MTKAPTSCILLNCHDINLGSIYTFGLPLLLGIPVLWATSEKEAEEFIKEDQYHIKLIISFWKKETTSEEEALFDFFEDLEIRIPLIGVGPIPNALRSLYEVQNPANLSEVGDLSHKILETTPPDQKDVVPVFLVNIIHLYKQAPFSLYLDKEKKDTYLNKNDTIPPDDNKPLFIDYQESKELFSRQSMDFLKSDNSGRADTKASSEFLEMGLNSLIDQAIKNGNHLDSTDGLFKQCRICLENIVEKEKSVESMIEVLLENKNSYHYCHMVANQYVSRKMLKAFTWGSEEIVELISYVGIFQDMYTANYYNHNPDLELEEDLIYSEEVPDTDKELLLNHAKLAAEFVALDPQAPKGASEIILHHHGMPDGVGFSMNKSAFLSPVEKLLVVAESFVEEYWRFRKEGRKTKSSDIIKILSHNFTHKSYKPFLDSLNLVSL
jgi:hypothetical protein